MENLTPEKFDELRDKIINILKDYTDSNAEAATLCISALNELCKGGCTIYALREIPLIWLEGFHKI